MKKNISVAIFLLNFSCCFSQIKKHNLVLTSQICLSGYNFTYSDENYNIIQKQYFRTNFQYFLNSRLSIGFLFDSFQKNRIAKPNTNYWNSKENSLCLTSEIQYNFFKTKLTPFIKMKIANFKFTKLESDNPYIPPTQKTQKFFELSDIRYYGYGKRTFIIPSVGLSYFVNSRIGVSCFYEPNSYEMPSTKFSANKIFIGGQIILN